MVLHLYILHQKKGNADICRVLLKFRANPNAMTTGRFTPLHFACNQGHRPIVQMLLYCNADATIRDKDGLTPAALASQNDFVNIANYIKKATIPVFDFLNDPSIIHLTYFLVRETDLRSFSLTCKRHYTLSQYAWEYRCKSLGCSMDGSFRMISSTWSVHSSLVEKIILNYGLTFEQSSNALLREIQRIGAPNAQPVHINPVQAAIALVEHGTDPNTIHKSGISAIHLALLKGANELVHLLAERGADINHQKPNGNTPLHDLAALGRAKICDWIVKLGADPNIPNEGGDSAILYAAKSNQWKVVFLLASLGGDVNQLNLYGENALHIAIEASSPLNVIQRLLDSGININQCGFAGNTALHTAARDGNIEVLKVLLEHGANPDVLNTGSSTPLHVAAYHARLEAIKILIQYNADPNIKNLDGHTVYHTARVLQHKNVLDFLNSMFTVCISRDKGFFLISASGER